jgi:hypothetical protein
MSKRKVVDVIDLATTSSDDEEHPTAGSQQPPQPRPPAKGSVQARSNGRQTVLSDVCRRGGSKAQPSGGQPSAEAPSQKEPESSKGRKASSEEGYASKKARTGSDSSKVQETRQTLVAVTTIPMHCAQSDTLYVCTGCTPCGQGSAGIDCFPEASWSWVIPASSA